MSKEALVQAVKKIVALTRSGDLDQAYQGYRDLFSDPTFPAQRAEDQRQALRLMIHSKSAPEKPTPAMAEAYKAAIAPLKALIDNQKEPADYEMLGMCHVLLGEEAAASEVFRAGLNLERERNPTSDLCGAFMKRISLI